VSENVKKENYTAVALHMIIKCMAKILQLHKAYVNVKSEKHFYKIQKSNLNPF